MASGFVPCAVIPVYDHERTVGRVLERASAAGLHCFVMDDGSCSRCARELERLAATSVGTRLMRLPENRGKGYAVMAGFELASAAGYTHALQIDADAQHSLEDIPRFIAEAREHPDTVICGRPVFDASMPALRRYGRFLTHALVWLETLSLEIPDSLCGFRVYPLEPVMRVIGQEHVGSRMDFDVEIIVRLYWRRVALRWLDTRVVYPPDGVSHYRLWRDNARMVALQTRLLTGMLPRLPALLARKLT